MSIPAKHRRVFEDGDPDFDVTQTPRMIILYGPHLHDHMTAYTIRDMERIEAGIRKMPKGPKRKQTARLILANSWELDIDRDGRVILPKELREKVGLQSGGEMRFRALGDHVELWNKAVFEEEDDLDEIVADLPEGYDPMDDIPDVDDLIGD